MLSARIHIALAILVSASHTDAASARQELQTIHSDQPALFERFGSAVATQGDLLVCGAEQARNVARFVGSAEVLRRVGHDWVFEQELFASDGRPYDLFGHSLAIDHGVIAVGAPKNDEHGEDAGAVYLFQQRGGAWVQTQKLTADDALRHSWFGASVSLSARTLVVGAPNGYQGYVGPGALYVYRFDGSAWVPEQKLSEAAATHFGRQTSVADDLIVVGGSGSLAAYIYRFDGGAWAKEQELLPAFGGFGYFGYSICTDGERVIVGDRDALTGNPGGGAAWIYRHDGVGWIREQELRPVGGVPSTSKFWQGLKFGASVAIDGPLALGRAPYDCELNWLGGAGFRFRHGGTSWAQEAKISVPGASGGQAGTTTALAEERAVLGAPYDAGHTVGTVYVHAPF